MLENQCWSRGEGTHGTHGRPPLGSIALLTVVAVLLASYVRKALLGPEVVSSLVGGRCQRTKVEETIYEAHRDYGLTLYKTLGERLGGVRETLKQHAAQTPTMPERAAEWCSIARI